MSQHCSGSSKSCTQPVVLWEPHPEQSPDQCHESSRCAQLIQQLSKQCGYHDRASLWGIGTQSWSWEGPAGFLGPSNNNGLQLVCDCMLSQDWNFLLWRIPPSTMMGWAPYHVLHGSSRIRAIYLNYVVIIIKTWCNWTFEKWFSFDINEQNIKGERKGLSSIWSVYLISINIMGLFCTLQSLVLQEINRNMEKEKVSRTWVKYTNDDIFTKCKLQWSGSTIIQCKTHEIPASGGVQLKYLTFEHRYHSFHLCVW